MNRLAVHTAHRTELANDRVVEIAIDAETVIKNVGIDEYFAQLAVELGNRKRCLRTKLAHRAFDTRPTAVPNLSLRIARPYKQRVLVRLGRFDDGDRIWFLESGQIKEVGILTKTIMRVVGTRGFASAGNNGHGVGRHAS